MALYVFGIGGTGARVIKALTMLLASGVEVEHTECVVPILIDPDNSNGDLTRTIELLRLYKDIRRYTEQDVNGFFRTELRPLTTEDGNSSNTYHFQIEGVRDEKFRDVIDLSGMDRSSQALTQLLFSEGNLAASMEVGFKGNPNIGSVVLNKFKDSPVFQQFAAAFNQNDRVMIIGSIFGGTGAAGLPLLIKNLRDASPSLPKHQLLRDAPIGAVSVLPYFDVETNEGVSIDSNTFISKTKAAFSYYAENICRNNSLNAFYYLGDAVSNTQKGADGAAAQKNKAHFVELAAAMAVVDFMRYDKADLAVSKGRAESPMYFEYGLKSETNEIQFRHLGTGSYGMAAGKLSQYFLFQKFFRDFFEAGAASAAWKKNGDNKLNLAALNQRLVQDLRKFDGFFEEWLGEMEQSNVKFKPFNRDTDGEGILNSVIGFEDKPKFYEVFTPKGLEAYNQQLDKSEGKLKPLGSSDRKLFGLFYTATKELVEKKIKL